MRSRLSRHLDPALFAPPAAAAGVELLAIEVVPAPPAPPQLPDEFNWRDHTVMLLHVAAQIEHALMVQYLFAAYSLGGPQVPDRLRDQVRAWQETILGIAKEEMGHLITVQNVLTLLGAPLELDRDDYPVRSEFYPFDFALEPLSRPSLAKYVYAESPSDWQGELADAVRELAETDAGGQVAQVGLLYALLITLIGDAGRLPDDAFDEGTQPLQASWDEWGRGYSTGARGFEPSNVASVPSPDVLVIEAPDRAGAVEALKQVGEQGEAFETANDLDDELSHFRRFLTIFEELSALPEDERRLVSRPLASNPTARAQAPEDDDTEARDHTRQHAITHPEAKLWGHLLNLRYRMLLVNLAHAFELEGSATDSPRGLLIHRTFGEMYNLRAIAGLLVALPLRADAPHAPLAAPPFEMPYTLDLPSREGDRLKLHRDLLEASGLLAGKLRDQGTSPRGAAYLTALEEADANALADLERAAGVGA